MTTVIAKGRPQAAYRVADIRDAFNRLEGLLTETSSVRSCRAAIQKVRKIDKAIKRSEKSHGISAQSNRRDRLNDDRRMACEYARRLLKNVEEEGTLTLVNALGVQNAEPTSAMTPNQWRSHATVTGILARVIVTRWMSSTGLKLPGAMDVEAV